VSVKFCIDVTFVSRPAASRVYLFHDQIPSIYNDVHVCGCARGSAGYCRKRAYFIYLGPVPSSQVKLTRKLTFDLTLG